MTRKHLEAIAHTLNANRADFALVADFADMCEEFDENFDRKRFIVAASSNRRDEIAWEIEQFDRVVGMAID